MIFQAEMSECGLACMAMLANYHGHRTDIGAMRRQFSQSIKGSTLKSLIGLADSLDFSTRAVRTELDGLRLLRTPCILHWDLNHFVVLKRVHRSRIVVHDPARGICDINIERASKHFTGVALEVAPTSGFESRELRQRTRLRDLIGNVAGLKRSIFQALLLSALLQFFLLITPFYVQLVIDHAVSSLDAKLLVLSAVTFAAIYLFSAVAEALRAWVTTALGQSVSWQMTTNTVRHLSRLPISYFEKRFAADIISRVGSCRPIQQALTQGMVEALVDSAMALTTAIALVAYNQILGLAILATVGIYVGIALLLQPLRTVRQREEIQARAKEQARMLESIHGAATIKLFGLEAERDGAWSNLYAGVVNASIENRRLEIWQAFTKSAIFGIQIVLVVYMGARMIMDGHLTIGMLMAVLFYRQMLADRMFALVAWSYEWTLMGVHLERLSDIVQTPRDQSGENPATPGRIPLGGISLEGVRFRYSSGDTEVIKGVDLHVQPGEFVAIKGPSGGGKTTLLKLVLGFYQPTEGKVLIDGQPLHAFGRRAWNAAIGVVQQEDRLLAGSIADNISLYDPAMDMERVVECAKAAHVHDEIEALPMNYFSLVGEMGSALSGGQKQRILLARALYRRPSVLFLDEGTANLDEDTEAIVAETISRMTMTRIVIAHRPALVQRAERVFEMRKGVLDDITPSRGRPAA
jgi:ATP-binding cassette subfamily B protein RaxB